MDINLYKIAHNTWAIFMISFLFGIFMLLGGCTRSSDKLQLFSLMPSSYTHVTFSNQLPEDADFNIVEYLYYYNGGGVAVGDINNDGLKDLFFTANLLPNKLYLNKGHLEGNFVFEDISESAGVEGMEGWSAGVAMADVNGDGYLDIYVSQLGDYKGIPGANQLFINNGKDGLTFTDKAKEYGVDRVGYATQASFFDYDNDGDLDLYLLNHSTHDSRNYGPSSIRFEHDPKAGDKLLRNDIPTPLASPLEGRRGHGGPRGVFVDVTQEAGIYDSPIGYGLAVTAGDINNDGCIDLFVSNDFHENDYLYLNNCDGTFRETLEQSMGHTSHSSMGNDLADFNNDGLLDIVVLDMLPEEEHILKKSVGEEGENVYNTKLRFGYHPQLARNTLQLNQGNGLFSEIALLSEVYATDWSWAPLLCDLDNDGYKDLFVSNGIVKRPNDQDYINFKWQVVYSETLNKSSAEADAFLAGKEALNRVFIAKMPTEKIPNKVYQNNGDLTFTDKGKEWGMDQPVFSNGAAYADLDNDGDLDIVLNNINQEAFIYRNNADVLTQNKYIQVQLIGSGKNTRGIGAKVILKTKDQLLYQEQMPVRGFLSTVDDILHFGVGQHALIDTLKVIWPDRKMQILTHLTTGKLIKLDQKDASLEYHYPKPKKNFTWFEDVSDEFSIDYQHVENEFVDYDWQFLMPHKLSTQGPKLAVGDVNGDGLDDLFCGGAAYQPAQLFLQKQNGKFVKSDQIVFEEDKIHEDIEARFFDADGDHDLDLYVVSGGNEWSITAEHLKDRLYLNDGKGNFSKSTDRLPAHLIANGSCVEAADFDQDGDLDLFVGSRSVINNYGLNPRSYLLQNNGFGKFEDVTDKVAPQLTRVGMVADAVWSDIDHDQQPDLIVVGEWMPITVFKNNGGKLTDITGTVGLDKSNGWWNCVTAVDIDGDGDQDLVAGNLGLNAKIKASAIEPASLYVKDFDHNSSLDHILCFYKNGTSTPFATRDELVKQLPLLKKKFPTYEAYARVSTIHDIFNQEELEGALIKKAYTFQSSYIENLGNGTFQMHPLSLEAQFSPVFSILAEDFDQDHQMDLLLGGNFHGATVNFGLYDASYGLWLKGDGKGRFEASPPRESGWVVKGEIRDIHKIQLEDGSILLVVARNNDRLKIFDWKQPQSLDSTIRVLISEHH